MGSLATQWLRHQTTYQTVSINEEDLRHVKDDEEEFQLNKRTQMNLYFTVIIVAVLALVVFGPSIYTNMLYSRFDLTENPMYSTLLYLKAPLSPLSHPPQMVRALRMTI